jgi:hypothetical protein
MSTRGGHSPPEQTLQSSQRVPFIHEAFVYYPIDYMLKLRVLRTEFTQSGNCRFSGVHSIMMEKLAQASEGEGCTPTPFHYIYHQVQSCSVHSSLSGRYTLPFSSLSLCILWYYGYYVMMLVLENERAQFSDQ